MQNDSKIDDREYNMQEENTDKSKSKKKMSKSKKIFLSVFSSLLAVILICFAAFYGVFFNEINAFFSIKKQDEYIYSMTYKNDYFFDEYLKQGAKTDSELKDFIITKLLHGLPIDFKLPDYGCSSFIATTENEEQTFARNLDIEFAPIMVVKTEPSNAYKSISMVNLSALGFNLNYQPTSLMNKLLCLATPYIPFDGMNEKGVAICVNMVNGNNICQDTDKIDITTTTLIRLVLDYADNTRKAIDLIKQYDLYDSTGGPYHFLISDKSGDSVVIEYYNNEIQVIENQKILTNHALNEFEETSSTFNKTFERYNTIKETIDSNNGTLTIEQSQSLLSEVALSWDNGGALYSVIYNLNKLELQFAFMNQTKKIYKYSL